MFVLSRDVSVAKRVIATLLATAIVLWASGAFSAVQAANITDVKDTLSDSSIGADSNHSFEFVTPTGVPTGQDIVITFPAGFDLGTIGSEDIDLGIDGVYENIEGGAWTVATTATTITLSNVSGNDPVAASTTILVGLHATNEGAGNSQIGNPTPAAGNQSYEIDISAGNSDSGHTRVVILDTVEVTAQVNTNFEFNVIAKDNTDTVNGDAIDINSSSTTIPFGVLTANTPVVIAQDLTVESNAINGFVVTVQTDSALLSSTGADIDYFKDGTTVTDPEAWEAVSVGLDINDENTWGHWGITTEDATTTRTNEFDAGEWAGVATSPVVIFSHDGPADAATAGIGSTTVGYKVEISALQEAADDYSTTLTYIATPTF